MSIETMISEIDDITNDMLNRSKRVSDIRELMERMSVFDKFREKHDIVVKGSGIGFSEKEKKWYGWSNRAIVGFGIGDNVFEVDFGDDNTPFVKHGSKTIKNMADAEESARRFAKYVS